MNARKMPALAFSVIALLPVALLLVSSRALANPRPLPFTYGSETLNKGGAEIEQYVDLTPVPALSATTGAQAWYLASQLQTEFEYGITDRLELGLYVTIVPRSDAFASQPEMIEGNGAKERLRYRFGAPGEYPIDIALYGELTENEREFELEGKVILQRRLGDLRIATNLWVEEEFEYSGERTFVFNPTLGITYQARPVFHPGVEAWARVEFPEPGPEPAPATREFNDGPHVYLGPTAMFNFGRLWWSAGAYLRATDATRPLAPADAFGRVYARTIIGIGFD